MRLLACLALLQLVGLAWASDLQLELEKDPDGVWMPPSLTKMMDENVRGMAGRDLLQEGQSTTTGQAPRRPRIFIYPVRC